MRAALSILAVTALATSLLKAQQAPAPEPEREPAPPRAVRIPLGVKEAKPEVPSPETLLERSKTSSVEADTLWLVVEHAKRLGITSIDLGPDGRCHLIERRFNEDGSLGALLVRSGDSVPEKVRSGLTDLVRRRDVIYGSGGDRIVRRGGADRLRFGLAADYGASVHTSQFAPFDGFPVEVRRATIALVTEARKLPVDGSALGVISAEFVDPRQAVRLTTINGRKLFPVPDAGRGSEELPPMVVAARMPGRKIVVTNAEQWKQIEAHVASGGGGPFLITVGRNRYFRIFAEAVTVRK